MPAFIHSACNVAADQRFGPYDFAAEKVGAPNDLKDFVDSIESIAFRRRTFERRAMLEEMMQRAGPAYKKQFLEKEASTQAAARPPTRRVSAITTKAMWLNNLRYFRVSLAIATSLACLANGKAVICMGSTGKSFLECHLS